MRRLLDTNIVSDILRDASGAAATRLERCPPGSTVLSIIVAAEIRFGLVRKSAFARAARFKQLLGQLSVAPFDELADRKYAELRAALERAGTPIGANDMLIAAHALALDCTLVTANEREFRRVAGLRVENWLA